MGHFKRCYCQKGEFGFDVLKAAGVISLDVPWLKIKFCFFCFLNYRMNMLTIENISILDIFW